MTTVNSLADFAYACALAEQKNLNVVDAAFDGKHFGYWHIRVRGKHWPIYVVSWEAREGWLVVATENAAGFRETVHLIQSVHDKMVDEAFGKVRVAD